MTTAFSSLETKINRVAVNRLADAEALIGTATVLGFIERRYEERFGMVPRNVRVLRCLSVDIAGLVQDQAIKINGVDEVVAEIHSVDSGWSEVILK